jgi:nitrate reductase NapAB chaperone NapD
MPICSYVVVPAPGVVESVTERLEALDGCDVTRAENRDLLLLVTDTASAAAEGALREQISGIEGILALLLAFGEIDPDSDGAAPSSRRGHGSLSSRAEGGHARPEAEYGTPSVAPDR